MKLLFSLASPFVRKVRVVALEAGYTIGERGDLVPEPTKVHPVERNESIRDSNPLAQVPTLILDDGTALHDSRVIVEYLDAEKGAELFPAPGPARWRALVDQSLADGVLDAGLLARYEDGVRPEAQRHEGWKAGQMAKIRDGLDAMERRAADYGDRVDIGTIATGCTLGWLDFRFGTMNWREGRPALAAWFDRISERPSFRDTVPVG